MAFNNYLEDENDKPYFTKNSLAYYYDKMEGFSEKVEQAAKILNVTKEEVEKNITDYIEQNKNELDQRLAQWDGKLETFDSSVETLLTEWVDDGTLTHVIDSTLIDEKIQPLTTLLQDKVGGQRKLKPEEFSDDAMALVTGNGTVNVLSIPQDGSVTPTKTNFVKFKNYGKNLYNKDSANIVANSLLAAETGGITTNPAYKITDFVPVVAGSTIITSRSGGTTTFPRTLVYYDSSENYVSGVDLPGYKNVVPEGVSYVRLTIGNDSTNVQVESGQNVTAYEAYKEIFEFDEQKIYIPMPESDITSIKSITKNLYNPVAVDVSEKSLIGDNGVIGTNSTYEVTGFMNVEEGDRVSVSRNEELTVNTNNIIRSHGWYDINKIWVGGNSNIVPQPLTAPAGAKYLRITHNSEDKEYQVEIGSKPTFYVPYEGKETVDTNKVALPPIPSYLTTIKDRTILTNGDSITAEQSSYGVDIYGYPTRIADAFSMNLVKYAIGGSTLAVRESEPTTREPLVTRYQNMSNTADLILIAIGTNDWQYDWTPLGTMTSRSNFTFYGALHNLCVGLIEKYPGKPIVFGTPIKRSATPYAAPDAVNSNGKTLGEYGDIIKEVCGFYGIPVLDMFNECTLNPSIPSQLSTYMPDGTHPNSAGHEIMARRWIGYLKQLL